MVKELVPLKQSYSEMRRALRERNGTSSQTDGDRTDAPSRTVPAEAPATPRTTADPDLPPRPALLASDNKAAPLKCAMRIPWPAPGSNSAFDLIAGVYGDQEAVRLIFARAFERWIDGFPQAAATLSPTARYPVAKSKVYKAGRAIDAKVIEEVRARLDPYGLRKIGWLAQAIGLAAMSDEMERLRSAATRDDRPEAAPRAPGA